MNNFSQFPVRDVRVMGNLRMRQLPATNANPGKAVPWWWGAAVLSAATFFAYSPAIRGGFIWDDEGLLTQNRLIKQAGGLEQIWFSTEPIDYWPLTNTSFWLEWRLWGDRPTGYHATNLLLQVIASLLVWSVLRRLSIPGAFFAALLWAVHPVNVESIAWIAQRKNTLSIVFALTSVLWYLKAARYPTDMKAIDSDRGKARIQSRGWYWLSVAAFFLAMLSKGSVAILPLVLLLIEWWRRGRITRNDCYRIAPFVLVAVPLTLINIWFQHQGGVGVIRQANFFERLADAGFVVWFYLSKALLPIDLAFIYPQPRIETASFAAWMPLMAALAISGLLIFIRRASTWRRGTIFAWGSFCAALVPVMGLTDVYFMKYSLVADHYGYISLIAVAAWTAAAISVWVRVNSFAVKCVTYIVAMMAIAALAWQSHAQSKLYESASVIYENALRVNPNSWMLHNNLSIELLHSGRIAESVDHARIATELNPLNAQTHTNLGNAYLQAGEIEAAIREFQAALDLDSDDVLAISDLGNAFLKSGRVGDAIGQYARAIRLDPTYVPAQNNLGSAYVQVGRVEDAIEQYQKSLKLDRDYAPAHNNLGNVYMKLGRVQEAIAEYRAALELNTEYASAHNNLGYALLQAGQVQDAMAECRTAVRLKQDYPEAHNNLGNAMLRRSVGQRN